MSNLAAILTAAASPVPDYLLYALQFEGQHEIAGIKNNPVIMSVLDEADGTKDGKTLGANNDDEAYCAKGLSGVLEHVGIHSTRSAWARSYLTWKDGEILPAPCVGAIAIFERGPQFGHVSIVIGRDVSGDIICFGFNQGDAIKASAFETQRVLGFRFPKSRPIPTPTGFLKLPLLTIKDGQVSRNEA